MHTDTPTAHFLNPSPIFERGYACRRLPACGEVIYVVQQIA